MTKRDSDEVPHDLWARIFVGALFAASLYLMYRVFRPFLAGLVWAVFLATICHPLYRRLAKKLRGREGLAAFITATLVFVVIVLPFVTLISGLSDSVADVVSLLRERVQTYRTALPTTTAEAGAMGDHFPILGKIEAFAAKYFRISKADYSEAILNVARHMGAFLATRTQPLVQNIFHTLVTFLVMLITMPLLLRHTPRILELVANCLPLGERDRKGVLARLRDTTRAIFFGVMMTAAIQATLGGIGWAVVSLPQALVAGIGMFFCALLPIGGTLLIWGPAVFYLFATGEVVRGTILLVFGVATSSLDNFVKPIFISGRSQLPMILVFFGILGGLTAFGFLGLFLGPLVITLFLFLLEVLGRDLASAE